MGSKSRRLAMLALLLCCSIIASSCEAVTAQNIPDTGSRPGNNGMQGGNGGRTGR
ncbi:MAG: hypothetical protein K0R57_5282 [Paenibacillaceae bacterium]|jgi:hypothetical protein|nr:hypothetical protein [Paenibacillaceae bacterium]